MPGAGLIKFVLAFLVVSLGWVQVVAAADMAPAPQTINQAGVKVTVAPRGFPADGPNWDFEITLETHTQSLDDDLAKSSVLIVDGKSFRPLGWNGSPAGGHHRKGVLRFWAVAPRPASVELQIRRSGEASPRSFRWQLK